MRRCPRFAFLSAIALILAWSHAVAAEQPGLLARERRGAAIMLGFGRTPTAAELEQAGRAGEKPFREHLAECRRQLENDPALRRATVENAFLDAFGRVPTVEEVRRLSDRPATYADLVSRLVASRAGGGNEAEDVLHRAYRFVVRRDAYDLEIDYWKKHPPLSYAILVGCIEDWARRNQPGLMVTAGTPTVSINSSFLSTLRLSPGTAEEIRAALGLEARADAQNTSATGRNPIAPTAGQVVTGGGIHFVAIGAPNLRSASVETP